MVTAQQLIESLGLRPLPIEGGYFRETFRASETISREALPDRYDRDKALCSAIYYLLTSDPGSFSAFHRLPTDEIYHFYLGDPIEMTLLYPDGEDASAVLGRDLLAGQHVQFVVPRDVWQGARLLPGGRFALLGTTMAPAFDFRDYIGGARGDLVDRYPHRADRIRRLTRDAQG